jgi:hypothetical protein
VQSAAVIEWDNIIDDEDAAGDLLRDYQLSDEDSEAGPSHD